MTFILGIWRQKYIEELSWHNPKESCLYFRIKLENKIILCTLFFPLIFKDTNLWNEFSVVFFFLERVPQLGKYFPAGYMSACEPQTLFAELLLSYVS